MLSQEDIKTISARGITEAELQSQVDRFKTGFPYLRIAGAARTGNGIVALSAEEEAAAAARWEKYLADGGTVAKFVPASGAASRMFKALFAFVDGQDDVPAPGSDVERLIAGIHRMPFYGQLNEVLMRRHAMDIDALVAAGRYKDVVAGIISEDGLNYGNLPKGLLSFHAYPGGEVRTPVEEQLVEGAQSATGADGCVKLHFTVSGNHRKLFEAKLAEAVPAIEKRMGVKFDVSMSEQKPSTDTVAVNPDNTLFRDNGSLVFRPGGHGALIQNLNDMDSAVVFIKNIDNVVPDSRREATLRYKRVIAGYLIEIHDKIAAYLAKLDDGCSHDELMEMLAFSHDTLNIGNDAAGTMDDTALAAYLKGKFDRPLRVCGMVRNEGEPGGGPYIAFNADGTSSPQILESTQIDPDNVDYSAMVAKATHFNPVDLVCYIRDVNGNPYDLPRYVDSATGFISSKSFHGKTLRALELPGLWNGAMSDWNTVFVEVPIATFNPVKTVNDLLRPAHQA